MESWIAVYCASLISMTNPIGNAGLFAGMIANQPDAPTKAIARKCAISVLCILLISTWAGSWFLAAAGISIAELKAGGGVIVLLIGLHMVFNDTSHAQTGSEATEAKQRDSIAIVPLAIPIVSGPGTIALVVATAAEHSALDEKLLMSVVGLLAAALIAVFFSSARKIASTLGEAGMAVVTRLMGVVLASTATGMLAAGIRGLFPELFA